MAEWQIVLRLSVSKANWWVWSSQLAACAPCRGWERGRVVIGAGRKATGLKSALWTRMAPIAKEPWGPTSPTDSVPRGSVVAAAGSIVASMGLTRASAAALRPLMASAGAGLTAARDPVTAGVPRAMRALWVTACLRVMAWRRTLAWLVHTEAKQRLMGARQPVMVRRCQGTLLGGPPTTSEIRTVWWTSTRSIGRVRTVAVISKIDALFPCPPLLLPPPPSWGIACPPLALTRMSGAPYPLHQLLAPRTTPAIEAQSDACLPRQRATHTNARGSPRSPRFPGPPRMTCRGIPTQNGRAMLISLTTHLSAGEGYLDFIQFRAW